MSVDQNNPRGVIAGIVQTFLSSQLSLILIHNV